MGLFTLQEKKWLKKLQELSFCNPFLPERIELEKAILGPHFIDEGEVWHIGLSRGRKQRPNVQAMINMASDMEVVTRNKVVAGSRPDESELKLYETLVLFSAFHQSEGTLLEMILSKNNFQRKQLEKESWLSFDKKLKSHFSGGEISKRILEKSEHYFAIFFQMRRGFYYTFSCIAGKSLILAKLRASVWQSIFTYDLKRYRDHLYDKLNTFPTLITGPSGTGKELVAQSIGLSQYIPFDSVTQSFAEHEQSFLPLNLSAMSPTLIESELFGHVRGSFTGAVKDRKGWLESCSNHGCVFLDEIGELNQSLQVKLLRVLQSGAFQRVGESEERTFEGKIIAATHRDLSSEIEQGKFRMDFYYRLCADIILMPSLCEIIADQPDNLKDTVSFISEQISGEKLSKELSEETLSWIENKLGWDYSWPGNFRELEQCIRNIIIRREYIPLEVSLKKDGGRLNTFNDFSLSADEMLGEYITRAYAHLGSYEECARKLKLDRRTVKSRVDPLLLEKIKESKGTLS